MISKKVSLRECISRSILNGMPIAHLGKFVKVDINQEVKNAGVDFGVYTNGLTIQYGIQINSNLNTADRWKRTTCTSQALTKKDASKFKKYMNGHFPCADNYHQYGLGYFVKDGIKIHPRTKVDYYSKHNSIPKTRRDFDSEIDWINGNLRYWEAKLKQFKDLSNE